MTPLRMVAALTCATTVACGAVAGGPSGAATGLLVCPDAPPMDGTSCSINAPPCSYDVVDHGGCVSVTASCTAGGWAISSSPCVAPRGPSCQTDDECADANGGLAAICPTPGGGACLAIATADCTVQGKYQDRNALLLPWLLATTSTDPAVAAQSKGDALQIDMAYEELSSALPAGGLPPTSGTARRPLVRITCEVSTPEARTRVFHHLDELSLPVVVGSAAMRDEYAAAAASKASRLHLVVGDPAALRSAFAGTGDTSLLYQHGMPTAAIVPGLALRVPAIEAAVRADPSFVGEDVRVAVISDPAGALASAVTAVASRLVFNGKSAADNGPNYRALALGPASTLSDVVVALCAFTPEIILLPEATDSLSSPLVAAVEACWPAGAIRPTYLGTGLASSGTLSVVGTNAELAGRVQAVSTAFGNTHDATRLASYAVRYHASFPQVPTPPPTAAYEAFYAMTYALVGAGDVPDGQPRAADVLRGLQALKTGRRIFVGVEDLLEGTAALVNDGSIQLTGLESSLAFSPPDGFALDKGGFACITYAGPSGAPAFAYAGLAYDAATKSLTGAFACP
jgi:hypothetical protein